MFLEMLENGTKLFITLKIIRGQMIHLFTDTNIILLKFASNVLLFFPFLNIPTDNDFMRPATQNSNLKKRRGADF